MDHFHYNNAQLHAEDIVIADIAADIGTPFYCYSTATLARHYDVFRDGLHVLDNPMICFAVKANSNPHVLAVLAARGAGADVVSEGEIRLALHAGVDPEKIIFSGVGKQRREMRFALSKGIFQFNVESEAELRILSQEAEAMNMQAPVALRVNPDVDAGTHEKITTGRKDSKFGVDIDEAPALYHLAHHLPGIKIQGVSVHIGSQLTDLEPFRLAYMRVKSFVHAMRAEGHDIRVIDLGGGLGIPYDDASTSPPAPDAYGRMVADVMKDMNAQFVFEPGRMIAGNAGVLISSVLYTKQTGDSEFLIIDAAMNDLARPALYDAHHTVIACDEKADNAAKLYNIVGPICESTDIFARGEALPELGEGDLVAFRSAGAYGAVMSSTYNARPVTPEVLVDGDTYRIIRARKEYDALLADYGATL